MFVDKNKKQKTRKKKEMKDLERPLGLSCSRESFSVLSCPGRLHIFFIFLMIDDSRSFYHRP